MDSQIEEEMGVQTGFLDELEESLYQKDLIFFLSHGYYYDSIHGVFERLEDVISPIDGGGTQW